MSNKYSLGRTNWLRYSWLLVVAFLFSQNVLAQLSAYTFTQSTGTYTPVTGNTVLATGGYDDATYSVALPFTFNFNGASYTNIWVSTNGYIAFGATDPGSTNYTPISGTALSTGYVAGWGRDGSGMSAIGGRTSEISWAVEGSAPNRTFVVQYKDARHIYSTGTTNVPYINWQVRLSETSNNVALMYGPSGMAVGATNASTTVQIGLRGATNADYSNRTNTTTVSFNSSTAGTGNANTQAFSSVNATPGRPTDGLTYTWAPPAACTGTPTAGTTTSPVTNACFNASFTLNVTGASTGVSGLTYEWETSPDGLVWTPTGVTTATYTVTQTAASQYRRRITCAGSDAWSTPVSVGQNVVTQCYCAPVSSYGCADGDVIAQVILNTLDNNTGTGCPSDPTPGNQGINQNGTGYSNYTDYSANPLLTTALQAGGSYTCTVWAGQYGENYAVWIDYNDDGVFATPSERVGYTATTVAGSGVVGVLGSSASFPINLACNPPLGEHRMRVRAMYGLTSGSSVDPCVNNSYGEVEDYLVTITTPVACPAPTGLTASNATTTSIDLAWTVGCVETDWDIEYGPAGFTPGTGTIVPVSGTPATTLTGLAGGTAFDFYVNADCGVVDGLSAQFGPISGLTLAANDNCSSVTDLATLTSPYTSSTVGTANDLDPCANGNTAPDVIFSIDVPDGNVLTIGQTNNLYDSYVHVYYGGACPGTTQIACFDDPDIQNIEWFNNTGSTQTVYWVQDGYSSGAGEFTLEWTNVVAPTCGDPTASGIAPGAYNVSFTMNAHPVFGVASGYEYEIVPTTTTPTGVGTASATATVFGAGTLTASTTYDLYIRTDCGAGGFSNWVGPYTFTTSPPPPANDDCANAIAVTCAGTPVSGTTVNSTLDFNYVNAGAGGSNTTERGVWYSLAGDDQQYTFNTCSAVTYDSRLSVYSGTCGALVPIAGNDDNNTCTTAGLSSSITFNAYLGTTYYIFVHGYQFGTTLSTTGAFDMNISCAPLCLPIPGNDECANATVLTGSMTCTPTSGNNLCASPTPTMTNPSSFSSFATLNDVWYTFTPTYADNSLTITNGTALQMGLAFYDGTCGAFTPLYSNSNMTSGVPLNLTGFTIGVTYYIRVLSTVANAGTFDICVVEYPCATPTAATATATSNTTVDVAITGAAGDYIIEYGPVGFTPGTGGTAGVGGTIVSTNTLNTTVTVAADNNYDFYVRKDCSGTAEGYSFLVYAGTVTTYTVVPTTGSATITTCSATIYDSGTTGDYLTDCDGTLVIEPASASGIMVLGGTYGIESGTDVLEVYEGVGTGGTLLASYSGSGTIAVQATAPNTALTVRFVSDWWNLSGPNEGFVITASCQEVCTDIPAAAALTGNSSVCPGETVDIELVSPEIGLNYIWQRRYTAGGTWVTIPGETNPVLSVTQTVATEYRARLNCDYYNNLGATVPTQSWFVTMNAPTTCYCAPTYSSGTGFGDFIQAVSCGTINNVTGAGASPYYTVYASSPTTTTTFSAGGQYSISVTTGTYTNNDVTAWIDFNQNGVFDEDERLGEIEGLGSGGVATFYFTVAPGSVLGNTTLRVREADTSGSIDPCAGLSYGETEDYTVTIVAGASNDAAQNATVIAPPIYPACLNLSGDLALATDDPQDSSTEADLWYSFTASSNACRIAVSGGTATNVEIELQDGASSSAATIVTENAQLANGNEILITDDLVSGTQYWVAIRNAAGGTPGTFTVCIQSLAASTCDNGPTFAGLCSSFKADWVGTGSYTATFTSVSNPLNVYSYTTSGTSSWIPLTVVTGNVGNPTAGGLQYGESYDVIVASNFTLPDATGASQSAVAAATSATCTINILPAAAMNVGVAYRSTGSGSSTIAGSNPRSLGSWIQTNIFMCGAIGYQWHITEVDYLDQVVSLTPATPTTVARQVRLNTASIPGISAGKRYRVKVAPIFAWGTGSYDEASSYYVQVAGSAGMVAENNDNEVVLVDKTTETGVFASLYPNPSNGEMVNINIAGIESESVNIRIMDASGRIVWSNNFFVEGILATSVNFDRPLAAGVYMVEMTYNGEVSTQRMVVQK